MLPEELPYKYLHYEQFLSCRTGPGCCELSRGLSCGVANSVSIGGLVLLCWVVLLVGACLAEVYDCDAVGHLVTGPPGL